jgi:hypothetical protein
MPRTALLLIALPVALATLPARAETIGGNPGPAHNYVCPNADGKGALDCYFDAIAHLYTMCRQVKSIEIIEHGYEKSDEGVNSAKSEFCMVKQRINIVRPYQGALREASISRQAVEGIRALQDIWLESLDKLKWTPGESDADYKARVAKAYETFRDRTEGIRKVVAVAKENAPPAPKPAKKAGRDRKPPR